MEKNGGSCAGKQRFHVFASDISSTRPKISSGAISVACVQWAEHVCGQCVFKVSVLRLPVLNARMWPPCVDLWPAVIAGAALLPLAFASSEEVFRFKTRERRACEPPVPPLPSPPGPCG